MLPTTHLPPPYTKETLFKDLGLAPPAKAFSESVPTAAKPLGRPSADAVMAYADGSSLGNPGPSGWACVIEYADGTRTSSAGPLVHTTNNRVELHAAIQALLSLPEEATGELRLDSEYIVKAVNDWRPGWVRKGWKNSQGQPVSNADLFKALFELVDARPGIRLRWVKAHAGDPLNELCDTLANAQAMKARWSR